MPRTLRFVLAAVALAAALPASPAFHLWRMEELYSNADGSVQYLELSALASGEQFVRQHTITSRNAAGTITRSFTFPNDLPGDSGGKRFLIGTAGFAALNVVQPDFVVPNGFFFPQGGTINYAENSDLWIHGPTPADPDLSLQRDGTTATNSPQNFAGQVGRIMTAMPPPPPALNFQGLWWRSPAGSEDGWGVNLSHQGDVLFATWFSYDTDGTGMWLVMSAGVRQGTSNTYTGALYRTTGSPFNAYDASRFMFTEVGTATFTFTDADNGTFAYQVGMVSQSKAITRQVFATPVPVCSAGTTPSSTNFQDLWWAAPAGTENGWGVNITHQGEKLFATWFTYGADGRGRWFVMSNGERVTMPVEGYPGVTQFDGFKYRGTLYETSGPRFDAYNASQFRFTEVGQATFEFMGPAGEFTYTVQGVTQTKTIVRQVFASPITVCR